MGAACSSRSPHQANAADASVVSASRKSRAVQVSAGTHAPRSHISVKRAAAPAGSSSLQGSPQACSGSAPVVANGADQAAAHPSCEQAADVEA